MIPEIERKEKEAQESVVDLEKQQEIATGQEKQTEIEAKEAQKFHNEANAIKQDCDRELGKALPALNAAIKSLDILKPADIGEMRGYKEPPADLKLLL
jgi:dynein heavy chain